MVRLDEHSLQQVPSPQSRATGGLPAAPLPEARATASRLRDPGPLLTHALGLGGGPRAMRCARSAPRAADRREELL